jgi:hypothetical protein
MIDHLATVERLMAKLTDALPIPARVTPELAASLRGPAGTAVPPKCAVTWIYYMGDEGGILCKLDLPSSTGEEAFVSITHLRFDPRLPVAREITAYQKHRVKRLRRQPP